MGMTFENLTWDDLCDLMCGDPEDDIEAETPEDIKDMQNGQLEDRIPKHS